ncbi:MAG: PAS domain-containing protein [Anaerolineales bacterium]|jgi:transcriptional regulator with PAS, ATPase and Fis domain
MKSDNHAWVKEFPAAITVSDADGILLEMNDKSAKALAKDGGRELIGKNMLECHPDPARGKVERLLKKKQLNVYTIEKNGIKKLIYQSPWYVKGEFAGFVELSLEIPFEIPHFIRD